MAQLNAIAKPITEGLNFVCREESQESGETGEENTQEVLEQHKQVVKQLLGTRSHPGDLLLVCCLLE